MFQILSERYTKIFERPAPVVTCDKVSIEASSPPGFYDGYFIVKNAGGGNLEGDIFAGSSLISLSTRLIEGNDVIVEFEMDLRGKRPGETFESRIVLTTSGGQLIIPVKIEIGGYGVKCGRLKIHTLADFAGCVRALPEEAAALFPTPEFERWLTDIGFEHLEFYYKLAGGSVGIRELDGFLTICGAKEKAALTAKDPHITITVPFESAETKEAIMLQAVSWGTFVYDVKTAGGAPWLRLSRERVTSADFQNKEYPFEIYLDRAKVSGEKSFETVVFESASEKLSVDITVKKQPPFTAALSRFSYKSEDSGYLIITNNSGGSIMLEVAALESFVRFKAAKYMIDKSTEIPFEIKVNSFLNLGIGRKPINISDIICRTVMGSNVYKQTLTVKAGSLISG